MGNRSPPPRTSSAERWLRTEATRYSIDKQRIGIWGVSAGGQLAAITGTSCEAGAGESACVQAVAAWYGIFDFAPLAIPASPPARYLGCESGHCAENQVSMASAIRHVDRSDPPFLLIHGTRDQTVSAAQSRDFHAELRAQDVKSELLMIEDVDHSFIGNTPAMTRAASLRALQATIDFFDRTLVDSPPLRLARRVRYEWPNCRGRSMRGKHFQWHDGRCDGGAATGASARPTEPRRGYRVSHNGQSDGSSITTAMSAGWANKQTGFDPSLQPWRPINRWSPCRPTIGARPMARRRRGHRRCGFRPTIRPKAGDRRRWEWWRGH